MEKIDVLNENGEKTGKIASREEVHKLGLWHKCVHIWIVNSKNEILLQKRSPQKVTSPNKWTASTSGHLSAGDSSLAGALRELEEEIGLTVDKKELDYLFTVREEDCVTQNHIINKEFTDVFLLKKDVLIQNLTLQEEEVSSIKWFSYEEFLKMVIEKDETLVHHTEIHLKLLDILAH